MKKFEDPKVDVYSFVAEDIMTLSDLFGEDDVVSPVPGTNETPIG